MAHPPNISEQQALEIGRRQSMFREVNEKIEAVAADLDLLDEIPIFCECGSANCHEHIALTETEYERPRRFPTHFAVLPGHDLPAVERVVEKNDRYLVVEKFGESAIAAIKLDPRRRAR